MTASHRFLVRPRVRPLSLALFLALAGCSSTETVLPDATMAPPDAVADIPVASDLPTAPPDVGPTDTGTDGGVRPDVFETCLGTATDTCPLGIPGPCPDLSDGLPHPVALAGLHHDITLSCSGRAASAGPDAVLPLTLPVASDVVVTVTAPDADAAIVGLSTAAGCGTPGGELACANGGFGINGTGVVQRRSLPAGVYYVVVANAHGGPMTVQAMVTPSPVRPSGSTCPGVAVTPDGPPVMVSTHGFPPQATYGTTCGAGQFGGLGYIDAVFSYTLTENRDVTVEVAGSGSGALQVDVSPVCGSHALALPGCASGEPATRTLHNQPPGTYYVVADYEVMTTRTRVLTATVTTTPPSPPGPASHCPGVPLTMGVASTADIGTLTAGDMLACIPRQRAEAVFSLVAPTTGDVMVHVASPTPRYDAALELHAPCTGPVVGACTGPVDRSVSSVWARYRGLTPGATYSVRAATSATTGLIGARYYVVPATTPAAITGNETCVGAAVIPPGGGIFTGTTVAATAVAVPSCVASDMGCTGSRLVLYRLVLTARQRVVAVMTSTEFDALLAIQSGPICPGTPVMGGCNDDSYSTNPQVEAILDPGTYWLLAGGCGGTATGRYTLDVAVMPPPTM